MKKVEKVVLQETKYIAIWVIILSIIMESIFLILGKWDYTVLLGNLFSGIFVVANFFFLGITVQNAVAKNEKEARATIKASQSLRTLVLFVVAAIGVLLPCFNIWASIIPLFFARVAVMFRPYFNKK